MARTRATRNEESHGNVIHIQKPGPPAIVEQLKPIVKQAMAFAVVDVATHEVALERVKTLRQAKKQIAEWFEPTRKAIQIAHKENLALRDGFIAPIDDACTAYDNSAGGFEREEERKAEDEQRRLQAEATRQEEERRRMDAIDAEERGDTAEAAAIMEEPIEAPVVIVAPQVAKVAGVSTRKTWGAEVHDLLELVKYVAAHPEWINLVEANGPALNKLAQSQHEALRIPGVRAVSTSTRATRS